MESSRGRKSTLKPIKDPFDEFELKISELSDLIFQYNLVLQEKTLLLVSVDGHDARTEKITGINDEEIRLAYAKYLKEVMRQKIAELEAEGIVNIKIPGL